jgi:cob(I)alamin adenosyltransferase
VKIYTKTGDDGTTALFGGGRVAKDDLRVEAYGTVDELNSVLGVAVAALAPGTEASDALRALIYRLQGDLFVVGAALATLPEARERAAGRRAPRLGADRIASLEAEIDRYWDALPPLRNFILPGGTPAAASLHLARAVARRAERRVVALARTTDVDAQIGVYLNRLSDLLFVLARAANAAGGGAEMPWRPAPADTAPQATAGLSGDPVAPGPEGSPGVIAP